MSTPELYTYKNGEKVPLEKEPAQFVARALPQALEKLGFNVLERVSPRSTRIFTIANQLESDMALVRGAATAHHDYRRLDTKTEFLITDRISVKFAEPPSPEALGRFQGHYSLLLAQQFSPREFLFQLTDHTGMNPVKLVVELMESSSINPPELKVESAEHDQNYRVKRYALVPPTDRNFRQQWHLHDTLVNPEFDVRSTTNCQKAWELLNSYGDPEVVVGITDDGCKLNHADFNGVNKFAGWGYFKGDRLIVDSDIQANPARMYETDNDHGTSCAGVVGAEVDGKLTVGAAPGCRLLPIKWEISGENLSISDSKVRLAFEYLNDKVDVISNSWGSTPINEFSNLVLDFMREATITGGRRGKGVIFVWAAGNENCPIKYEGDQEIPYTPGWDTNFDPPRWAPPQTSRVFRHNFADIPGSIQVAALSSAAQRSHYSNYGLGIDITAPSNNVHSYYRLRVAGLGITTTTGFSGHQNPITTTFGGTSSASPLVAAIAALVISANPSLSALEVVALLKRTASRDLDLTPYARTPAASYDPDPNWDISPIPPHQQGDFINMNDPSGTWSPWFGFGKIDAKAAIAEALSMVSPPVPDTPIN